MSSNAPILDTAQVLVNWTIHDKQTQNQLFFRHTTGPITPANLDVLRDRVRFSFQFNFLGGLGAGVVLRSIECKDRTTGGGIVSSVTINAPAFPGPPAAPSSIALSLIQWVSAPSEVHPSRAFVAGVRLDQITANEFDPSVAAGLLALWATNNASHRPFGWEPVRVSLYAGGAPRPAGVATAINGYSLAHLRVSDQRRRE